MLTDRAIASLEADQLRDEIRSLGNVNLDAMAELTELENRTQELANQLTDIDSAKEHLERLVVELDATSRVQFEKLSTWFARISAEQTECSDVYSAAEVRTCI